jgi:hypothetical protein
MVVESHHNRESIPLTLSSKTLLSLAFYRLEFGNGVLESSFLKIFFSVVSSMFFRFD